MGTTEKIRCRRWRQIGVEILQDETGTQDCNCHRTDCGIHDVDTTKGASGMEKALISHGNSPAIVIDKPVLDLLQITADTKIELTTNGDSIMLAPVHDRKRQSRLQAAKQKFSTQFGDDLTKLAEQFSGVRSGR